MKFEVIGYDWRTVYHGDVFSLNIKVDQSTYNQIKEIWENEKSNNNEDYQSMINAQAKTYEILKPCYKELSTFYVTYAKTLYLINPQEKLLFEKNYINYNLNKNNFKQVLSETFDLAFNEDHVINFNDIFIDSSWYVINIVGSL